MTPGDGVTEGALPLWRVAGATRQQRQAFLEPSQQGGWREHPEAGSRQFDGERESIQPPTDVAHDGSRYIVEYEFGADGTGTLDEEADGGVAREELQRLESSRVGQGKGGDRRLMLTSQPQGRATGDEDVQARTGA